ncbi:MAG TPA: winged helix-turn-helix domain-containing protein [Candidatus Thermoplasmatota archaeon]|nr:winged helix-turn-helix domain-containing protein [Candidatus Thermoplasmatota archaeon]
MESDGRVPSPELAGAWGALSPTRMQILRLVSSRPRGVCELARGIGINKSAVHKHLQRLVSLGLLTRTETRNWVYYRIHPSVASHLVKPPSPVVSYLPPERAGAEDGKDWPRVN